MNSMFELKFNKDKLMNLLSLMEVGLIENPFKGKNKDIGEIRAINYYDEQMGIQERNLPPSNDRLVWLVEHLGEANKGRSFIVND